MKHKCSVNGCPNKGVYFSDHGYWNALCKQHRRVADGLKDHRGRPVSVWQCHDGKKVGKPREWDGRDHAAIERYRMELLLMPETAEEWAEWERRHHA